MSFQAAFYKGTRPGISGLYNRIVRWWTRSEYSHCELVFSGGFSGSASFIDGGVRLKVIDFDPEKWDVIELPGDLEADAFIWFLDHRGANYDLLGNIHFIVSRVANSEKRWFCSEAIGAALGMTEAWRFDPASLAEIFRSLYVKRDCKKEYAHNISSS